MQIIFFRRKIINKLIFISTGIWERSIKKACLLTSYDRFSVDWGRGKERILYFIISDCCMNMGQRGCGILNVEEGSVADKAGIRPADRLLSVNGHWVEDNIDFLYHAGHSVRILTYERAGKTHAIRFKKSLDSRSLGIALEDFPQRTCNNRCIFCFVLQLPPGLRASLYFKDEDFRLSFLYGNYITATNLSDKDMDRIIRQRLSPLYISVHATNQVLRRRILGNIAAPPIMPILKRFKRHRIRFHVQIVLLPGWNDGKHLEETLDDLIPLYPALVSIAIVPVGLTAHRKNLPLVHPVTPSYARGFLCTINKIRTKLRKKFGTDLLFLSDEFYFLAGEEPPSYRGYGEIPQLENGVGMVAEFYRGFSQSVRSLPSRITPSRKAALVTGVLGKKVLKPFVNRLNRIRGLDLRVLEVPNYLLGKMVTVSGLMAGRDMVKVLRDNPGYDAYLIPENCLNKDGMFLDDLYPSDVEKETGCRLIVGSGCAADIINLILGFSPL